MKLCVIGIHRYGDKEYMGWRVFQAGMSREKQWKRVCRECGKKKITSSDFEEVNGWG